MNVIAAGIIGTLLSGALLLIILAIHAGRDANQRRERAQKDEGDR